MYIGKVAKLTSASPKAIRHYESLGLLGAVQRSGEYRVYSDQDILTITMIRQAQKLGFKLAELVVLKNRNDEPDWPAVIALIDRKRRSIAQEIERLHALEIQLNSLDVEIRTCVAAQNSNEVGRPGTEQTCPSFDGDMPHLLP